MPDIDPARAAFVLNSHRWSEARDYDVLAVYPEAREIELETQLAGAAADTLAASILDRESTPKPIFIIEIDGLISIADLIGGVPRFSVTLPQFGIQDRVCDLLFYENNYLDNIASLKVQ